MWTIGRRCAQHDGHPILAVARPHSCQRSQQAVLLQRHPGQTVVTALPLREACGQGRFFKPVDAADPGIQRGRAEIVATQAATAFAQRRSLRVAAATQCGGGGIRADGQRRHGL